MAGQSVVGLVGRLIWLKRQSLLRGGLCAAGTLALLLGGVRVLGSAGSVEPARPGRTAAVPAGEVCERAVAWSPSLVWDGETYGVAWLDGSEASTQVRFMRFDRDGRRVGRIERLTRSSGAKRQPHLAQADHGYGVVWVEDLAAGPQIYFARLRVAAAGRAASLAAAPALRLDGGAAAGGVQKLSPRVVAHARGYSVAWLQRASDASHALSLWLVDADREGRPIGSPRRLLETTAGRASSLDLATDGAELWLTWSEHDPEADPAEREGARLRLLRVTPDDRPVAPVATLHRLAGSIHGISLAVRSGRAAVVFEDYLDQDYAPRLQLVTVAEDGQVDQRKIVEPVVYRSGRPGLAWSPGELGIAWRDLDHGRLALSFSRLDGRGEARGPARRLAAHVYGDDGVGVAWNGQGHAAVWSDCRSGKGELYLGRLGSQGSARLPTDG